MLWGNSMSGMSVVAHNLQAMAANRYLGITGGNQAKSTEKLSSGYKINRAADDAAGLSISEKMRKQIRGLSRGTLNAEDGVSMCQIADGALNEVHDMLHRITELSVQSANGTNSAADRRAIQAEVNQIIGEIDRVSETSKFNEIYLFKPNSPSDDEIIDKFMIGTYPEIRDNYYITDGNRSYISAEHMKGLMGIVSNMVLADNFPRDFKFKQEPDDVMRDVGGMVVRSHFNMCDIYPVMNQAIATFLPMDPTKPDDIEASTVILGIKAAFLADSATAEQYFGGNYFGIRSQFLDASVASNYDAGWLDGQATLLFSIAKNPFNAEEDYGASKFASLISEYMDLATGLNSGELYELYTSFASLGSAESRNSKAVELYRSVFGGVDKVWIQAGADVWDGLFVEIGEMNSRTLGIKNLDVSNETGATEAIERAGVAVRRLSTMRSKIGAQQNRLEHTIANQKNIIENTQHSESVIRDTDMAEEMVRFSKESILQQAGQSMLAQANRSTEGVLALLR